MNLNQVNLAGRLTKDPEIKTINAQSGAFNVATISLAITKWTKSGEKTNFINVDVAGKAAENVAKFCVKGTVVMVTGEIETGSYDKNGSKVFYTKIKASKVQFGEGRVKQQAPQQQQQGYPQQQPQQPYPNQQMQQPMNQIPNMAPQMPNSYFDSMEEVPF